MKTNQKKENKMLIEYSKKEKYEVSEELALRHKVKTIHHNSGFSIIE